MIAVHEGHGKHGSDRAEILPATLAAALTTALRNAPLPPEAVLAFVPVGGALPGELPDEIQKAVERRRRTYASGRRAARAALRGAGWQGKDEPRLEIGPDRLPDWPEGWKGSISHTDDVAAALVAPWNRRSKLVLGLDLERIITPEIAAGIVDGIAPEILLAQSFDPHGMPFAEKVTRAFSAKEALYKALFPGTRQFREFSAARIAWRHSQQGEQTGVSLTLTEDWGCDWPAGTTLQAAQTIAADHVVTIIWSCIACRS